MYKVGYICIRIRWVVQKNIPCGGPHRKGGRGGGGHPLSGSCWGHPLPDAHHRGNGGPGRGALDEPQTLNRIMHLPIGPAQSDWTPIGPNINIGPKINRSPSGSRHGPEDMGPIRRYIAGQGICPIPEADYLPFWRVNDAGGWVFWRARARIHATIINLLIYY